ncbi:MAG TPA: hypothetical protein VE089_10745 [Nitrososphaeraceae archaeon]|jgi:hypothetical protein|nr:hypothetical protein [Nitrososphaeraceae archaeon]
MKLASLMKLYIRIGIRDYISANYAVSDPLKEDYVLAPNPFTKIRSLAKD